MGRNVAQGVSLRMLAAIAQQPGTLAALEQATGFGKRSVSNAIQKLHNRELISRARGGLWSITESGRAWLADGKAITSGPGAKLQHCTRGLRERAWWLMRELGRWTLPDLLSTVTDGTESAAERNLMQWMRALERAGLVARLPRKAFSALHPNGITIWRLVRDIGRLGPVWQRAHRRLYDPNSGDYIEIKKREVCHE